VNWNFSDDGFSGAAFRPGTCPSGDFAGKGMLKPAGKWVREQLRAAR
jgi:endoglucanase